MATSFNEDYSLDISDSVEHGVVGRAIREEFDIVFELDSHDTVEINNSPVEQFDIVSSVSSYIYLRPQSDVVETFNIEFNLDSHSSDGTLVVADNLIQRFTFVSHKVDVWINDTHYILWTPTEVVFPSDSSIATKDSRTLEVEYFDYIAFLEEAISSRNPKTLTTSLSETITFNDKVARAYYTELEESFDISMDAGAAPTDIFNIEVVVVSDIIHGLVENFQILDEVVLKHVTISTRLVEVIRVSDSADTYTPYCRYLPNSSNFQHLLRNEDAVEGTLELGETSIVGRIPNGETFEDKFFVATNVVKGQYRQAVFGLEDTIISVDLYFCSTNKNLVLQALRDTAGQEVILHLNNKWAGIVLNPNPIVTNLRGQFQIPLSFLITGVIGGAVDTPVVSEPDVPDNNLSVFLRDIDGDIIYDLSNLPIELFDGPSTFLSSIVGDIIYDLSDTPVEILI